MIVEPMAQWVFTLVFVVLAIYSTVRMFADRSRLLASIGHGLHVVMSVDMAAMAWPWWSELPGTPQIVFFSAAAGWFALMLLSQCFSSAPRWCSDGHGPWHQIMHVVMMLTMVWMVVAMAGMGSMAGMDSMASGHHHSMMSPSVALGGVALTGGLIVAAMISLAELVESPHGHGRFWSGHSSEAAAGALMCLGMAAMCLPMLVV